MNVFARRMVTVAFLALVLAACGDDEASQRKGFIAFLQARILDKPGVHVARPTNDEAKSWGDYAKHYAIITDFNDGMDEHVSKPMQEAVKRGAVRSIQDLIDRRADLVEVRRGITDIVAEMNRHLAAADAAHAALKQPPDLKTVYDAAYDRDVTEPAHAVAAALPVAQDALTSAVDLGDYIAQHRSAVQLQGSLVQVSDPAIQRDLNARLTAMNEKQQATVAAQQRLRTLLTGR